MYTAMPSDLVVSLMTRPDIDQHFHTGKTLFFLKKYIILLTTQSADSTKHIQLITELLVVRNYSHFFDG